MVANRILTVLVLNGLLIEFSMTYKVMLLEAALVQILLVASKVNRTIHMLDNFAILRRQNCEVIDRITYPSKIHAKLFLPV